MKSFLNWDKLFDKQELHKFTENETGIIWLKLKSIMRPEIIKQFMNKCELSIRSSSKNIFEELYNLNLYLKGEINKQQINSFLIEYNKKENIEIKNNFHTIEAELYKLQNFSWGGDFNNSLDKKIITYVKRTYLYDEIINKIDNEISEHTKKYTLNSWYNNWTTILTEYLFKSNKKVISAVGKTKSVDFFIKDIPLDLKITYLPKEFIKEQRKIKGLKSEIGILTKLARENSIIYDDKTNEEIKKHQIIEQLKNLKKKNINKILNQLSKETKQIIEETKNNKDSLIKWLYENQGEMRLGSENRLFLVLIDSNNISDSWKIKRNFKLLKKEIDSYIKSFNKSKLENNKIKFKFRGITYYTIADMVFVEE